MDADLEVYKRIYITISRNWKYINESKNISKEDLLEEKFIRIRQIFNEQKPYIGLYSDYYSVASSWSLRGNIIPNWYNIFIDINNWYKN